MSIALDTLLDPEAPAIRFVAAPWPGASETLDLDRVAIARFEPRDLYDRALFHAELASAWSLPTHYGNNWDALADVLGDPATYGERRALVMVIDEIDVVLATAPDFIDVLADVIQAADRHLRGHAPEHQVRLVLVGPLPSDA